MKNTDDFIVETFRYLTPADKADRRWVAWSRCYEYPFVLDALGPRLKTVHNAACGGSNPCHVNFANELNNGRTIYNSDIDEVNSFRFRNWFRHDANNKLDRTFDAVVFISTLEHMAGSDTDEVMRNLMSQVAPGGKLILTFDVPDIDIRKMETFLGVRCEEPGPRLSGLNSIMPEPVHAHLNIAVLSMLRKPKRVSVILPTYNRPELLPTCVKSMLSQTYSDFELVIVDDGSEKPVSEVLSDVRDERVRLIRHDKNGGIAAALNTGHAAAHGEYLTWVSDDCWAEPGWLESLVRGMDGCGQEVGMVFADYFDDNSGKPKRTNEYELMSENFIGASFMYRRQVYEETGTYDPGLLGAEDWDYWCRIRRRFRIRHLDCPAMYHYKVYDSSIGRKFRTQSWFSYKRVKDGTSGIRNVLLLVSATGWYSGCLERLAKSARKHLFPGQLLDVVAFTDRPSEVPLGVEAVEQRACPWPYSTMMRYGVYLREKSRMLRYDYVFAIDADMEFVAPVSADVILPKTGIVAVHHPGFAGKPAEVFPYEKSMLSRACVTDGKAYYAGGFIGGAAVDFVRMCEAIDTAIRDDLADGIVAVWHDESHLNRYLNAEPPAAALDPSYCRPEEYGSDGARLLALKKNHDHVRRMESLSVMVVSKDRPFFLEQLLDSFRDVSFNVTVLFRATAPEYLVGYDRLRKKFWWCRWIEQTSNSMKGAFDEWLERASEAVMVCPDDNICCGRVDTEAIRLAMSKGDLFGFTLRLSPGICRTQDDKVAPSWPEGNDTFIRFKPADWQCPWNYVWDMSSTFYRKRDMQAVVAAGDFRTINELEMRGLSMFPAAAVDSMACFPWAPITNIFVDTNFDGSQWCVQERVTDAQAVRLFEERRRVDVCRTFAERDEKGVTHVKHLFLEPACRVMNSAVAVVVGRNCQRFVRECLESILSQTWADLGIVFMDDASTDNTPEVAERVLGDRGKVLRVLNRSWAMCNIARAVSEQCGNPDSVIFLIDADDKLLVTTAIEQMMQQHIAADVVWSSYQQSDNDWSCSGPLPEGPIRGRPWKMSHLRSFKKFLFDSISRADFLDADGSWMKVTWDQAIMLPIGEMVPRARARYYDQRLYYYRIHAANDHATMAGLREQKRVEALISSRPAYSLHPVYVRGEARVCVVVSYYRQDTTLPLCLESLFFQSVCPHMVVVADDGSDDGVQEWVQENAPRYPFRLVCVSRKHDGYRLASLDNLGASVGEGDRFMFTNADVVHNPYSVAAHARTEGVGAGMVRGLAIGMVGAVDLMMVRNFKRLESLASRHPAPRSNKKYVDSTDPNNNPIGVWGGNFSVPVELFRRIGGFDESYTGWGGEDNDLTKRCVAAGCRVQWLFESIAYHLDHELKGYAFEQTGSKKYAGV